MARQRAPVTIEQALDPGERAAARWLVERVRAEVPAELVQVSLFGSRARGDSRPDSDIDLLLTFRRLPHDREPQATQGEAIADQVAADTGVPITVWTVSLIDLERGLRTPMLVDALTDAIPFWCAGPPLPPVPFTPEDAVRCASALLDRVAEGEVEVEDHLDAGDVEAAARRVRDDLVRMCVGLHLLRGQTRPRRADAAHRLLRSEDGALPPAVRRALAWAATSYGPEGRDDDAPVPPPPDPRAAMGAVGHLRRVLVGRRARLEDALRRGEPGTLDPVTAMRAPGLH